MRDPISGASRVAPPRLAGARPVPQSSPPMTRCAPPLALLAALGLALAALGIGACSPGEEGAVERPNVLLVTLDTTRADHLGLYGYERPTSPNLDALAEEAVVYDRAYSTSSWTLPAHASLFTGKLPTSHGARHDPEGALVLAEGIAAAPEGIRARPMAAGEVTLAGLLAARGYATGAVVAGPWMLRQFGLAAGFDHYDDEGIRDAAGRRAGAVTDAALRWLGEGGRTREPFLLFLNYFDPHVPYAPPRAWARSFLPPGTQPNPHAARQAPALYDAEILYMDHELGRLFRHLRERGLWERTLVVVTGDHGELLGDRGLWGHERFLWEPLVRVPLVVKPAGPARPGRRDDRLVSLTDVLPLVLERLGLEAPEAPARAVEAGAVLAEVHPMSRAQDTGVWQARWEGRFKVLHNSFGETFLYDLASDPDEQRDLSGEAPERARRAREALEAAFAALPPPPAAAPVPVDEETLETLRALGYLAEPEAGSGPDADAAPGSAPGADPGSASRSQTRSDASE